MTKHVDVIFVVVWVHRALIVLSDNGINLLEPAPYCHSRLTDHDVLLVPDLWACRNDVVYSLFMCTTLAILIGSKIHFRMDDRKRPTPVCKRLNLIQAGLGRPSPRGLNPTFEIKSGSLNGLFKYSICFMQNLSTDQKGYRV